MPGSLRKVTCLQVDHHEPGLQVLTETFNTVSIQQANRESPRRLMCDSFPNAASRIEEGITRLLGAEHRKKVKTEMILRAGLLTFATAVDRFCN